MPTKPFHASPPVTDATLRAPDPGSPDRPLGAYASTRVSSDAIGARRIGATQLGAALLLAPLAWLIQLVFNGPAIDLVCDPAARMASALCAVTAVAGALIAWHSAFRTSGTPWRTSIGARGRLERDWFLARMAALTSTMFVLGLATSDLGAWFVWSCAA